MKKHYLLLAFSLVGCSPGNRPEMLGNTNTFAVEGNIAQELRAPDNGRIWVYDMTVRHRLFTSPISSGQTFVIDPVARQATINGQLATDAELPSGHDLKIVFTRTD